MSLTRNELVALQLAGRALWGSGSIQEQAFYSMAEDVFTSAHGVYDIIAYGALDSPDDIGPSVQAACDAAVAAGGGVVFIPPREYNSTHKGLWGWTTLVSSTLTNDRSLSIAGVQGGTAIKVPTGGTSLCEIGTSNGTCEYSGLIFVGDTASGVNVPNVIHIRQSRHGILRDCQFWGIKANAEAHGVARIIADGVHVSDCHFGGCDYAGTAELGGVLSITGERDHCIVQNCRFVSNDLSFRGTTYNKTASADNCWLWFGGQGLSGAVTAYGRVEVKQCYFESGALAIGLLPQQASSFIIQHAMIDGCTFNHDDTRPAIWMRDARQVTVRDCHFANASAGVTSIKAQTMDKLFVEKCIFGTGGKKLLFASTAPAYLELIENTGLTVDDVSGTIKPTNGISQSAGTRTVIYP